MNNLSYGELKELRMHLKEGAIKKILDEKIDLIGDSNKVCPVCNMPISESGLELRFGPVELRKKAVFDATDCLEYFLSNLRR